MKLLNNGLALLAGMTCVLGFAPFGLYPVPVIALAALFALWSHAATPRQAAGLGLFFGLGLFGTGVSWIYVALHDYGDMSMWLAALATFLFAAFLSLFTALAGYLQSRFARAPQPERIALAMPAAWVLIEWLRGTIFTGFPWLTLGYAQSSSMLSGYAPVLGAYGVSLVAAICAGLITLFWLKRRPIAIFALAVILIAGATLRNIAWTHPEGQPFSVSLVQGNIPQDIKFNPEVLNDTLNTYKNLILQHPAKLTVLPETAFPMMEDEVPQPLLEELRNQAIKNGGDLLIGSFERENGGYYNSVFSIGVSRNGQHYRKHHLVIFGEFIPLRPVFGWLINDVLQIPMGDLARGALTQPPLEISSQHVAVDICYEDVFGEEIITTLPDATLLVNVTNDAWYGDSFAAAQHRQMSQMRALETGRMMLRATNTGETVIIGADGRVLKQLPQHERAVLQGVAQGYQGITPYVRFGNAAVLLLIALMLASVRWFFRRKSAQGRPV